MQADVALRDRENAVAWELRGAWATGRPVRLLLQGARGVELVEGTVQSVAATDAFVILQPAEDPDKMSLNDVILDVAGGYTPPDVIHIPLMFVAEVRRPHFHAPPTKGWRPPSTAWAGQLPLDGQGVLGAEHAPAVSKRSARAMDRAVMMMLPAEQLAVLAALDGVTLGAPRGKRMAHARTWLVASEVGRSPRWTARRLLLLSRCGIVDLLKDGHAFAWRVASR